MPRFIEKFENDAGTVRYKFPLVDYEWETTQGLRSPFATVSGAHYGIDLLEAGVSLKNPASERLRFGIPTKCTEEEKIENLRSVPFTIGRGKLWSRLGSDRRWAKARMVDMPEYTINFDSGGGVVVIPVTCEFRRESDWRSAEVISSSQAATGTVTINNPGNARVYDSIFILSGTYTNPIITNQTNGYSLQSNRDGSSTNHWLKFDAGAHTVEFSSNGGSSYDDDRSLYIRPDAQIQMMVLEPGDNEFTFEGMSSATLAWSFYGAWH